MLLIEMKDIKMDSWDLMGKYLDKRKVSKNKVYFWVFFNLSIIFNL